MLCNAWCSVFRRSVAKNPTESDRHVWQKTKNRPSYFQIRVTTLSYYSRYEEVLLKRYLFHFLEEALALQYAVLHSFHEALAHPLESASLPKALEALHLL